MHDAGLRTIGAAHDCVKTSKALHADGHLAHASVKLSLEMLKIANAIREYSGEESGNLRVPTLHCISLQKNHCVNEFL